MKLYSIDVSNYGNIIKQTLLEEGFPFEMVKTPPNQEADYLAISPMGKIPAVETANGVLSETRAILSYIAASHPESTLFPTGAYTRAQHEELYSLVDLYIEEQARRQASLCRIFSNAKRVLILWALAEERLSVSEIASAIGVSLQNASQHLRLMKSAGIVASQREGKTITYRLAENSIAERCQLMSRVKKRPD